MAVAERFVSHDFAVTVGIGVAVSTAAVILIEYLALSRLAVAVTAWPLRRVILGIGVIMVAVGPVMLINPDRIYDDLVTPSLFALWLSQLITFAVYPRFVARRGGRLGRPWRWRRARARWPSTACGRRSRPPRFPSELPHTP